MQSSRSLLIDHISIGQLLDNFVFEMAMLYVELLEVEGCEDVEQSRVDGLSQ